MKTSVATAMAAFAAAAMAAKDERTFAVLRFTNKALTKGRMDPLVSPGQTSSHVHNIMGGSNFGLSSTGEDLVNSECTNADIVGDMSAYWFPAVYFNDPNTGELENVEIFYVNAYYFFEASNDDIKAFPVGMSMISGDAMAREPPAGGPGSNLNPDNGPVNGIKWTCPRLDNNYSPPSWPSDSDGTLAGMQDPNNDGEGVGFPDMNCDGYASPLRADIHFPSCYNPDAGLTNYQDNMAWPEDAGDGKVDCPEGWIHVPHLFLEVYWNTPLFIGRWTPGTGSQPFVLSNGDVTGFSSHADFVAAWDEDVLQHIIDTCDAGSSGMVNCAGVTVNDVDCTIPSEVDEEVDGVMSVLPGNNPLTGWSFGIDDLPIPGDDDETSPSPDPEPSQPAGSSSAAAPASSTIAAAPTYGGDLPELPEPTEDATNVVENPVIPSSVSAEAPPAETPDDSPAETGPVDQPAPTEAPTSTSCAPANVQTVWETVYVTEGGPAPYDSSNARRHVHGHLHGRGKHQH